ncbi:hypothetical protein ABZ848_13215 [Streptomyces sp. NPDC047081]|uniref:hypothetical protein n=1 Tax=Streptomyces sp. NPDC047081 TaxID=3154706 RepID=UPI0033F5A2B0
MAVEAVRILTHAMSSAAAGAGEVAQGVATRLLSDLVADRLRGRGNGREWEDFTRDPANSSLVEYLLRQEAEEDGDFRLALAGAVRDAKAERPAGVSVRSISIGGDGDARIGDRRDTYGDHNRVVNGDGSIYEGDVTQHRDGDTYEGDVNQENPLGRYVLMAVGVVVLLLLVFKGIPAVIGGGSGGDGLSASSTCKEFLNADQGTESQALVDIATSKGLGGFGSPLALPAIRYECSYHPSESLGAVIEQYKGQF